MIVESPFSSSQGEISEITLITLIFIAWIDFFISLHTAQEQRQCLSSSWEREPKKRSSCKKTHSAIQTQSPGHSGKQLRTKPM